MAGPSMYCAQCVPSKRPKTTQSSIWFPAKTMLRICCVLREMFSGRCSESATPFAKFNHPGTSASQSSMMKTRSMLKLMLFRSPRHEEQRAELQSILRAKVPRRRLVVPVIAQQCIKGCVFLIRDILFLSHPEQLVLVQLLPLVAHLRHLLGLFPLLLRINDTLFFGLFRVRLNGETRECRVPLHEGHEATLLHERRLILLVAASYLSAPLRLVVHKHCVFLDFE
mmetsp:Transcript_84905/g.236910  ORF Transcript_84905/g.236910 Transcript_84905/m.236910 type:complete len:225 (+) Transcript_84905:814-1488(+)